MTQRERQASGGVFDAPPTSGRRSPPHSGGGRQSGDSSAVSFWGDLFHSTSPAQQRELLALAVRQGVVYAHQLPAAANGAGGEPVRQFLGRLLAAQAQHLDPVRPEPVAPADEALDDVQREAVARALATPDICLIQGLPGTGKSRVVAEIVTQAAARGERVLLLAPAPGPVDRVLEAVAGREPLCPLRLLGPEESVESLPSAVQACTLAERERRLLQETLPRARQEAAETEERCRRQRGAGPLWAQLLDLAGQVGDLAGRLSALREAQGCVAAQVEEEAGAVEKPGHDEFRTKERRRPVPFIEGLRLALQARDAAVARLDGDLAKVGARLAELHGERETLLGQLQTLAPLSEARQHRRWWTRAWWQALLRRTAIVHFEELHARRQQLETDLERLEEDGRRAQTEREQATQHYAAERARLLAVEGERRQAELGAQENALEQEQRLLQDKWQATCAQLLPPTPRPAPGTAAVEQAREAWRTALRQEEERAAFARQWATCLEDTAATFPQRLLGLSNLVAATPVALAAGVPAGESHAPAPFDLLVLEGADQVTESEFLSVASRARRWVLVGQPAPVSPEPGPAEKPDRAAVHCPGVFERLWQQLHCDPRRLPYAWVQEKNGLCCRLQPVTPEQSQWLETERVADRPDIELRILARPRTPPLLAEVVFPPSMSIGQAKEYLFCELQELPVNALGCSLRWVEEPERVVLRLSDVSTPGAVPVALEHGVRALLHARLGEVPPSASWHTCCMEFERGAGWHRQRAEEWVHRHLGLCDLGRTARLDVPYRMQRDLAVFVSDLLFEGEYRLPDGGGLPEFGLAPPAVEFVPIPAPHENVNTSAAAAASGPRGQRRPRGGRSAPTATLPRKGGAGLELDLADIRHRDRLPSELRADLPGAGLVNYLEAQAVLRALEAVVADPAVRAAARRAGGVRATVAVLALYPAQAELIRRLIQQSPALAVAEVDVVVDVPAAFRERDCLVALVSLTRSHSHRAVSFGAGPDALALALTRARAKLLLFGDPGTLARRSQWSNVLDHLDATDSAREHQIITRLVAYLQGHGPNPHTFQVREGSQA